MMMQPCGRCLHGERESSAHFMHGSYADRTTLYKFPYIMPFSGGKGIMNDKRGKTRRTKDKA